MAQLYIPNGGSHPLMTWSPISTCFQSTGSVVPVGFPRPRSPELLREPAFHACCDELTQLLFASGGPALR